MNKFSLEHFKRPELTLPFGERRMVLHSCCAPCAGEIMMALYASEIEFVLFFYNPNIHPKTEYDQRKEENIRYARDMGVPFIDADYDVDHWFQRVAGLEDEPERGLRCTVCFDMRFERTALYAYEQGFRVFATTLGISRWKDMDQINTAGCRAASRYPDMTYFTFNWRKQGGSSRMIEIAKRENFYQQEYCGCVYSVRDTNRWRVSQGRPPIKRGIKFYGEE